MGDVLKWGPFALSLPDLFGLAGSLLLIVPVVRDFHLRWKQARAEAQGKATAATGTGLTAMFSAVAESYGKKRNEFSFTDSVCVAAGGIGLALSYLF